MQPGTEVAMFDLHTSGVTRVAMTAASVSARRDMMAAICSGDLPGPQMTSGNPVLAARHVSTYMLHGKLSKLLTQVAVRVKSPNCSVIARHQLCDDCATQSCAGAFSRLISNCEVTHRLRKVGSCT